MLYVETKAMIEFINTMMDNKRGIYTIDIEGKIIEIFNYPDYIDIICEDVIGGFEYCVSVEDNEIEVIDCQYTDEETSEVLSQGELEDSIIELLSNLPKPIQFYIVDEYDERID